MTTFTASKVRREAQVWTGPVRRMLHAYADRLEADEKAIPVGEILTREPDESCTRIRWADDFRFPEGVKFYTHPAPADAERLAEALQEATQSLRTIERGAMREEGLEEAENVRAYARSRAGVAESALAAHSAQAQPPAASVPDADTIKRVARAIYAHVFTMSIPRMGVRTVAFEEVWVIPAERDRMIAQAKAAIAAQENPNG